MRSMGRIVLALALVFALAAVCLPTAASAEAPPVFRVEFQTTVDNDPSSFVLEVTRSWAPLGADRFYELVMDGYYDDNGFFRVVPNFVVQFGLAADPSMTSKWKRNILDDPVLQSNVKGTVSFATSGPNTRTAQIFINLSDNSGLDAQGFAPFGRVVGDGMKVVKHINSKYGQQPQQGKITSQGNSYLHANYPELDYTTRVTIVGAADQKISTESSDMLASVFSNLVSSGVNPHQVSLYEDSSETTDPDALQMAAYESDDEGDRRHHSTLGSWMPWIALGGLSLGLAMVAFGWRIKPRAGMSRPHPV